MCNNLPYDVCSVCVLNVDGIPDPRREPESAKLDVVVSLVARSHISVLLETRTNDMQRILGHRDMHEYVMPDNCCVPVHAAVKGTGVAVITHHTVADMVHFIKLSHDTQVVWLSVDGSVFGVHGQVALGACYINPSTGGSDNERVRDEYDSLLEDCLSMSSTYDHVMLTGDFNAHVGDTPEFCHEHHDLLDMFPHLAHPRQCSDTKKRKNYAGMCLLDLAAVCRLVLTTGRGHGDTGQHTYRGYENRVGRTRTEHMLMSAGLYSGLKCVAVYDDGHGLLDHRALHVSFQKLNMHTGTTADTAHVPHIQLKWDELKQHQYARALEADQERHTAFDTHIKEGDMQAAYACLCDMICDAASNTGMVRKPRSHHCVGRRRPAWFDDECREAKHQLNQAMKLRQGVTQAHRRYRRTTRRVKRQYEQAQAEAIIRRLKCGDPEIYTHFKRQHKKTITPVTRQAWQQHMQKQFGLQPDIQPQQNNNAWTTVQRRHKQSRRNAAENAQPLGQRGSMLTARALQQQDHTWFEGQLQPDKMIKAVGACLSKSKSTSSTGFDHIGVAFLKYASIRDHGSKTRRHVLQSMIARLFVCCMKTGDIPQAWKTGKVSPLYKKGKMSDPGNYRMLAVSSGFYRLYASVLRLFVTDWCVKRNIVPECQFGFYPGRSTNHALFTLQHLINARCKHASRRLYAAFIDFKAAYDTVPRQQLWDHMSARHIPTNMLKAVQGLYKDDEYVLCDGDQSTDPVKACVGVRQGCPLSPLLFSVYISDIQEYFPHDRGAVTGVHGCRVPLILYAEDTTLLCNTRQDLQALLDNLHRFAQDKHMVVNVAKTCVVCFTRGQSDAKNFMYGGHEIPGESSFRYLGVVFAENCTLSPCMTDMTRRLAGASHGSWFKMTDLQVQGCPDVGRWVYKTFVLPHALYGCQVWSPAVLWESKCMTSTIHSKCVSFLRRVLHVSKSAASHVVLSELGVQPLNYYWLRCIIRFWNTAMAQIKEGTNRLFTQVLKADVDMGVSGTFCWSKLMLSFFNTHRDMSHHAECVRQVQALDMDSIMCAWACLCCEAARQHSAGDPEARDHEHRVLATYKAWCAGPGCTRYLERHGDDRVFSMARLRLSDHNMSVRLGRIAKPQIAYQDRVCTLCTCQEHVCVEHEKHAIFECKRFDSLRAKYHSAFDSITHGDMYAFYAQKPEQTLPFVHQMMQVYDRMRQAAMHG